MVLVDTSVWIRFLAGREPFGRNLEAALEREEVLAHELIFGELLVGDRGGRSAFLTNYEKLTSAPTVPHREVVEFVRARQFHGVGIGWIDAHLLASALVASATLWTADTSLAALAKTLKLAYVPG